MDLNVLIRGQSNAQLFADRGGAAALEKGLESRLGVDVHLLYEFGTDSSTIHSATPFMTWDTEGQQASLLRYVNELPADIKDNPTATVWMHNEYDQQGSFSTEDWLREVRADADMVRDALGQDAATTPYTFVPIRYPYGGNWTPIGDGMATLDADASFNAEISWAAQSLTMDGDGWANSSHMGNADAVKLGGDLAASMAETLRPLANGSAPAVGEPAVVQPPAPVELSAGTGPDALVLKISQDAYQGPAQYTVFVDGVQVGGTFTASAAHSAGQSDTLSLKGDWAAGMHKVEVKFLNDAWGGSAATDRNLHVDAASYNGQAVVGAAQAVERDTQAGTFTFTEAAAPTAPDPVSITAGSGPDALVLKISQDAYQGSAQYTVSVDGVQVGGAFTASAWHSAGQSDTLTLKGDWAAGAHQVEVRFLNDAWGGSASTDRNLHVDGATYNGAAVTGAAATFKTAGAKGFAFAEAAPPVVQAGTAAADLFDATGAGGVFTGGGGRDLFVLERGDGHVTVTDFATRTDKLVFVDLDAADVSSAAAAQDGQQGLLVSYGDAGTVFLAGVASLAARDMAFG
ncbi:MAG: macromolecule metabolism; macromolecule degradation; degradation of polysaccharides [uncultured Acetobacteraceae bacterium]|uniref:Macromolecule metabolism macromolecule degradation degradation of polysaccharides n=1 Tax=uncultured Acetobacteraceae bacterium TaxID=169975 RepID=A0A6J4J215_9PROT|nr:MAG: macromolecule metabolism; macromolecule degradation; degradation of polysaccharides [uncultured Acetobacteraceae bacterium]